MDSKQEELAQPFDDDPKSKEISDASTPLDDQNAEQERQISEK